MSANGIEIVKKELSYLIVKAFFEVYNELGFGFLEQIYARAPEIKACERVADASHDQLRNYLPAFRHSGRSVTLGMLPHLGPRAKYQRHLPSSRIRADSSDSRNSVVQ